ncbi:ABC transporter [Basilea psittacipulmonis DSM 24701]|uniref:ABC transporter n=1 Tax=Basilea psittacipulmonis DSM 24701 TaxID=1072685 RepID=A0A077DJN9_9BURK|nr:ABC transporter [Basilea psittacipulmonis DSM 24701]
MAGVVGFTANAGVRWENIKNTKTINLGTRDASLPFSYLDDNHQPIGYSIDICKEIVKAIEAKLNTKLKVNLVPVTSATRIPLVQNGTVDLVCGSATNNLERQALVSFAPTTFVTALRFVSVADDRIEDLEDMKNQTVTSTAGTSNIKWLHKISQDKKLNYRIIPAKDHSGGFLNVETGRAKAFFMDDVLLAGLVANAKDPSRYRISSKAYTVEPYGLIYPKGDEALSEAIDQAVKDMMKDGRLETLYQKWFMSPIPPKNIQLNMPMSDALKKAVKHPTNSGNPDDYQ